MGDYIVGFVTIDDSAKALEIARNLVESRLVACVNILPEIRSVYLWKDEICDDPEMLLIFKTAKGHFERVKNAVRELHPYDVPEIIAVDIAQGLPEYLSWIDDVIQ